MYGVIFCRVRFLVHFRSDLPPGSILEMCHGFMRYARSEAVESVSDLANVGSMLPFKIRVAKPALSRQNNMSIYRSIYGSIGLSIDLFIFLLSIESCA